MTTREMLRHVAEQLDCPDCTREICKPTREIAAALRAFLQQWNEEEAATQGDESDSRANIVRAVLLARLDNPTVTAPKSDEGTR